MSIVRLTGDLARGRAAQLRAISEDLVTTADGGDILSEAVVQLTVERDHLKGALLDVTRERDQARDEIHWLRSGEGQSELYDAGRGQDVPVTGVDAEDDQSPEPSPGSAQGGVTTAQVIVFDTDRMPIGIMRCEFEPLKVDTTTPVLSTLPLPPGWHGLGSGT